MQNDLDMENMMLVQFISEQDSDKIDQLPEHIQMY